MPIAKIEVCRSRPAEQVQALIDAVYQAQLEALKVPEGDKQIRYVEHKPDHCPVPPGKTGNYTFVEFLLFPGRSLEAKRRLYQGIVRLASWASSRTTSSSFCTSRRSTTGACAASRRRR